MVILLLLWDKMRSADVREGGGGWSAVPLSQEVLMSQGLSVLDKTPTGRNSIGNKAARVFIRPRHMPPRMSMTCDHKNDSDERDGMG